MRMVSTADEICCLDRKAKSGSQQGAGANASAEQRRGLVRTSRRDFVKLLTSSGISLSVSRLASAEQPNFAARETLPGRENWNPAAGGHGRIDALPKVTGGKLYASDFRAADLPGWPHNTSHAMLIRTADATHVLTGIDVSLLTGALKPSVVVT